MSGTTMKRVNATARRKYSNDSALFLWCESLAASIPERGRRRQEEAGGDRRRQEEESGGDKKGKEKKGEGRRGKRGNARG